MSDNHARNFLDELRLSIRTRDRVKVHVVLAHLEEVDQATRHRAMFELSKATGGFILPLLTGLLAAKPGLDAALPMLREILYSKALDSPETIMEMLGRETNSTHRIVLAETAGEIRLTAAIPLLHTILAQKKDEESCRGAITALGQLGDPASTEPISRFLSSDSMEVVMAAIQSLGQLGTPTAIRRLAEKLGTTDDLDDTILDVLAASRESEALEQLNATLSAQHAHLRTAGKKHLVAIGSRAVMVLVNNLHFDDPDLLIHTLNVLGEIGDEAAIGPIRKLLHHEPADPNIRFAAYEAIGLLPVAQGTIALARGLHDPVENVRSAAAGAINRNYNTVLAAGIKNLARDETGADRPICRTIIDAECDTIFLDLIRNEDFREYAMDYLGSRAHGETRSHYAELLRKSDRQDVAEKIDGHPTTVADKALTVFAVDDSKMILKIYRGLLHALGCEPVLFEFPAEAIKEVRKQKPDLIFTDLNMPDIDGVGLTRAVRQWFNKETLPIIMVTTQNETEDNADATRAGISAILRKPFTRETLRSAMEQHLPEWSSAKG